jgi:hypothetical protein
MQTTVIGIDCATQPHKVGLALGTFDSKLVTVAEVTLGSSAPDAARPSSEVRT